MITDLDHPQLKSTGYSALPQLAQLAHLDRAPGAVVLTLGGNDAGFADIVTACVLGSARSGCRDDDELAATEFDAIAAMSGGLANAYRRIWLAANTPDFVRQRGGAYAPVIVSTYPRPFWDASKGRCPDLTVFNATEQQYANELADALDASSTAATQVNQVAGFEVYKASSPLLSLQPDHTYCAPGSASGLRRVHEGPPQAMHPTAAGYRRVTDALATWDRSVTPHRPSDSAKRIAAAGTGAAPIVAPPDRSLSVEDGLSATLQPGQRLDLRAPGFSPGSPVVFTLHSSPTALGTVIADKTGVARLRSAVPSEFIVGHHELTAVGIEAGARVRVVRMALVVVAPMPLWVAGALGLAGGGVIALAVLGGVRLMRRRSERFATGAPVRARATG